MAKLRHSRQDDDKPTLLSPTIATPAAEADDPERPVSIPPAVWKLLRRYGHLIAVEERQLRAMHAQAPDDPRVARELARVGSEIDALHVQILALADAAEQQEGHIP